MQTLWRKHTNIESLETTELSIEEFVFPSGRQTVSYALQGLDRIDRVGIPEYSSQCVINAVGAYATPIPFKDVINYNIKLEVLLVYEQWGWQFNDSVFDEILSKYNKVIFDCVDSPNAHLRYQHTEDVIVSLSKCIGLKGGAILSKNGVLQKNKIPSDIGLNLDINNERNIYFINNSIATTEHIGDLSQVDILAELERETMIRKSHLHLFINSSLSNNWSDWMFSHIDSSSVGIVPLFKKEPLKIMQKINNYINKELKIASTIYNFNWSGSPLVFDYQPCIAFPIHSDMINIQKAINQLENVRY